MEMNDKLENAFKQALDNHELPYDAAAWKAVQKQLPAANTPWYWIGGAAAVVLAVGLGVFLYDNESSEINQNQMSQIETKDVSNEVNAELNNNNSNIEDNSSSNNNAKPNVITKGSGANAAIDLMPPVFRPQPNQGNTQITNYGTGATSAMHSSHGTPGPVIDPRVEEWVQASNKIEVRGSQNVYCENSSVTLSAINLPENSEVYWKIGKGKKVIGASVTFIVTDGLEVELSVLPKESFLGANPIFGKNWKFNTTQPAIPSIVSNVDIKNTKNHVTLTNTNSNIEHLIWRVDGKVCQGQTCATYMTQKGEHTYTVESYDRNGCFASTSGVVNIEEDYNLYVENTFTPNGDGVNDVFLPEALNLRAVNFKMTIFDRNGKVLFETTDAARPWNGTNNGQTIEDGVYVWVVTLINEEGQPEQYKGVVNLRR